MDFSKMSLNELYAVREEINKKIEMLETAYKKALVNTFLDAFKACKAAKVELQLETESYAFELNDFICAITMWDENEIKL